MESRSDLRILAGVEAAPVTKKLRGGHGAFTFRHLPA
jgi:hypothetical protein